MVQTDPPSSLPKPHPRHLSRSRRVRGQAAATTVVYLTWMEHSDMMEDDPGADLSNLTTRTRTRILNQVVFKYGQFVLVEIQP
jgi:hypothetical protein